MLKVLHLIQGYGGGISSLVKNLILSADNKQIKQDVMSFAYQNGELFVEELKKHGSGVYLMPRPRKVGYFVFRKYVLKIMREGKYDVVHCHTDGWRSTIFKKLAKKAKIPIFSIHAHRTSNNPGIIQNSKIYVKINQWITRRNADIRFTCGMEAAKYIYGSTKDAVIIPNGISLERCRKALLLNRDKMKSLLGIYDDEIVLLHVGRFVSQKNHIFLVDIADALRNKGIKFKLLFVGVGDLEEVIRKKVCEKGLFDKIIFLGRRNDVYELMMMADVMLLPSTSEGLPTVTVEAQAMGLHSLVSSNVTKECDLELGLISFLPIHETKIWVDAIEGLISHQDVPRERIESALSQNAYTSHEIYPRYLAVLKDKITTN